MTAGGGEVTPFLFLIFVLVGLKEACMLNFSFLGSFSGTSPGAAGRMLDISILRLTQPSLAGSGALLGNICSTCQKMYHTQYDRTIAIAFSKTYKGGYTGQLL